MGFFLAAWLTTLTLARAVETPYARLGLNLQDAATYRARTTSVAAGYRADHRYTLGVTADVTRRRYFGGGPLNDDQYYVVGSRAFGAHAYVDGSAGAARTSDIFARAAATLTPHLVFDRNDFGLGFRYADYRTGRTGTVNASYLHYFANGLTLGAGTYLVRAETSIASYSAQALYAYDDRHVVRLTGAAGRTLEDRGLEAQFNSLATEYTYTCPAGFSLGAALTDYWSQVRRERVIGLRLGWR